MKTKGQVVKLLILSYALLIVSIVVIASFVKNNRSSQTPDTNLTSIAFTQLSESNRTAEVYNQQKTAIPTLLTASPSITPTASPTLTESPTHTATPIHTAIPTQTSTSTEGPTATFTSTVLPTNTLDSIATFTSTVLATSTFTPTATFTPTLSSTPTPNPGLIWEGAWTGYFGQEIGSIYETVIIITVTGNQVVALADFRGSITTFTGTFTDDFRLLTGTWSCPPAGGNFTWSLKGDNQFVGNRDNVFAYCGSRNGESMPEPCFGP